MCLQFGRFHLLKKNLRRLLFTPYDPSYRIVLLKEINCLKSHDTFEPVKQEISRKMKTMMSEG